MHFFDRLPKGVFSTSAVDQIILNAGQIADEAILASFAETAAFWTAYDQKRIKKLDREYPGYREELNRRRTAAGLAPL